jgi:hypothetical protein
MKLTDLHLNKKDGSYYYLSATLLHEDEKGYYEINVPKIPLHISKEINLTHSIETNTYVPYEYATIDLGFGELDIFKDDDGNFFTATCIEEKTHEMTIDEIEKKLGYKIKIVKEH